MKLGKLQAKWHPKTLRLAHVLEANPAPEELPDPAKVYWGYKVKDWGMLGNDKAGDCVVAGALHMIINWSAHTGNSKVFTDEDALQIYSSLTGYDPETGANDTGLVMTDFLNYWQTEGLFGVKILGWFSFDHTNKLHFDITDQAFGGTYLGSQFPQSAMDQFNAGQPFSLVPGSPIDGGHCTPWFNHGSEGRKCVTWSKLQAALNPWLDHYVDESYGVISPDWFDTAGKTPCGIDVDALWALVKRAQD